MTIAALRCRLPFPAADLVVDHWSGSPGALAAPPAHEATAYLIRAADLAALRTLGNAFVDRGRKHVARSLASLLLGQPRVAVIAGSFTSAGQLRRSLRRLLERAAARQDRNAYIVAIDDRLFEAIARQAHASEEGARLCLLDPGEIPDELVAKLVGDSPAMQQARERIVMATRHSEPVLILGETGTGKEVAARGIHDLDARRRAHTFIPVNCAAIAPELFESELFGYERGAFTDARREGKPGLWEMAGPGTLFLDELGDLPLRHQVKILRALEDNKIRRVGANRETAVQCRVIAATNRDLYTMMQAGEFRDDLYYRLRASLIAMPPLRDHPQDVPALAAFFWTKVAQARPPLSGAVLATLSRYRWPGNARELRAVLVGLATMFPKVEPKVDHVRIVFQWQNPARAASADLAAADEAYVHRSACLRHLRQAEEVVLACKVLLKPFAAHEFTEEERRRVHGGLLQRITELHTLTARPVLFHRMATFESVHHLLGELLACHDLLDDQPLKAQHLWKRQLGGDVKATLQTIAREVERLLKKL